MRKMELYSCLVTMTNQGWVFCHMTHLISQSLCRDSWGKVWAGQRKSLERKSRQIMSMQRLTDSFYSSPPSSSSSSTPSTGATFYWGIHFSNMVQKNKIWPVKQHMHQVSTNIISESLFSALKSDPWSWTHGWTFLSDVSIPGWPDMAWLCSSMQCTVWNIRKYDSVN